MLECDECKNENLICAQAFKRYKCKICGRAYLHHNYCVPKICEDCAKEHNKCQMCGKDLN